MSITRKKRRSDTFLSGIISGKCPKCRKSKMFKHRPYSIRKGQFIEMYSRCPVCKYKFDIEPGFFIGATYVNYAFFIVILLLTYFTGRIFFVNSQPVDIFLSVLLFVLLLFPLLFRYSRIVYSYLFSGVKYNSQRSE